MLLDPLNDAMVMIKNAEHAGKTEVRLKPASSLIGNVLRVMHESGYIKEFEPVPDQRGGSYRVALSGHINDCGVIKPRFSVRMMDLERMESRYLPAQDFGVLILTTTQGVVSHAKAKQMGVGGRLLAYVY